MSVWVLLWLIPIIVIAIIVGVVFYKKWVWRYVFIIHDRKGSNVMVTQGRYVTTRGNPNSKMFEVKGFNNKIPVWDNTSYFEGKRAWDVTTNERGDLVPLKKKAIDQDQLQYAMQPLDTEIVIDSLMDDQKVFSPQDKTAVVLTIVAGIIVMLILIGTGWVVGQWAKGADALQAASQASASTIKEIKALKEQEAETQKVIIEVLGDMAKETNYTKRIEAR